MTSEIRELVNEYWSWLRDKTALRQVGEWVEITTPYLDRHNDYLQIYVKKSDNKIKLTDDAYIIEDLMHSGCELTSKKRRQLLQAVLNGFGIQREDNALIANATPQNFAQKKHDLLQAMIAVNDLFYTASANVTSLFLEDVANWLDLSDVRYVPEAKFTGKTSNDHLIHFVIPASRKAPTRFIQAINRPNRASAQSFAFVWFDIKEVRDANSMAYAIINDADKDSGTDVFSTLQAYDIKPILWSQRESIRQELAA